MNSMTLSLLLATWLYLWLGLFSRHRERQYRPRCPLGLWPTATTVLFWPWKVSVVFWKKWRRSRV